MTSTDARRSAKAAEPVNPRLVQETPYRWRIAPEAGMRVPGIVFASAGLLPDVFADRALVQLMNVAHLPGIVRAAYAMPDLHWGYGFPIGGVAATDVDRGGVVSPGGVGFDISCGVRLLVSPLERDAVTGRLGELMDALARQVPKGLGRGGLWRLSEPSDLRAVLLKGARAAYERGYGTAQDLERCEDAGALGGADPAMISERAFARGLHQLGSLGAGNHFLEVQVVERIFDERLASEFNLAPQRVCVMIHTGSRGLGHQVCTDHVRHMQAAMARHGISVPDRQLACAPVNSSEGEAYLGAMAGAANFARANRHLLAVAAREAFAATFGTDRLELLYDVSHNLAKLETYEIDNVRRVLCVHRKGATRALPPGHGELPAEFAQTGQPVLVPGSMGSASYVLAGLASNEAFLSACHGAGRAMSRSAARRRVAGAALRRELAAAGIEVRAASDRGLAEEAPISYKDVDAVVEVVEGAGLARRVARLVPIGVLKG